MCVDFLVSGISIRVITTGSANGDSDFIIIWEVTKYSCDQLMVLIKNE
jgi:hypothetical protein